MHLYYFNLQPSGIVKYVSDKPLEVIDDHITILLNGKEVKMPSKVCFYYDGSMCLYASPQEVASLMDESTSSLDNIVKFFSGFQKFVAPLFLQLSGKEKDIFTKSFLSFNYYHFPDNPEFCHILMFYIEYKTEMLTISENFDPQPFFKAIRKEKLNG